VSVSSDLRMRGASEGLRCKGYAQGNWPCQSLRRVVRRKLVDARMMGPFGALNESNGEAIRFGIGRNSSHMKEQNALRGKCIDKGRETRGKEGNSFEDLAANECGSAYGRGWGGH